MPFLAVAVSILAALLALLGHGLLWAFVLNRLHGHGLSLHVERRYNRAVVGIVFLLPAVFAVSVVAQPGLWLGEPWQWLLGEPLVARLYPQLSLACGLWGLAVWGTRVATRRTPPVVVSRRCEVADLRHCGGSGVVCWPGNESRRLHVRELEVRLPRWPRALDGLRLLHLSDLHLTGRLTREFYAAAFEACGRCRPHLALVTGDFIDREECFDWIPSLFGMLRAEHGVFYIFGNHDADFDVGSLRRLIGQAGWIHVGGRWLTVEARGQALLLAGNELPWLRPAADLSDAPPRQPDGPPRIALLHSPDQFPWAQANDCDLAFAGHTHGGQIRFPLMGAVLMPSRHGVRYAGHEYWTPPTFLHVSRGLASEIPLRYGCPPEVTLIVVRGEGV